jgi:Na+/H+ antiporter NhaD/arsenite permease-like protein
VLVALVIFVATYLLLAGVRLPGLRLERPGSAALGAMAMVVAGVVPVPRLFGGAINVETLALLFGTMVVSAYLAEAGLFHWASWKTLTAVRSPQRLLVALVFVSGLTSAVLVNDTVCLMFTPLVVRLIRDARLPPTPYLLALAFGANAGSVATPTGNPQNMLIGTLSGVSYLRFTGALLPPALACLALVALLLLMLFGRELRATRLDGTALERPRLDRTLAARSSTVLVLLVVAFVAGLPMAWSAVVAALALVICGQRPAAKMLARVDYRLLGFFAALFIVVNGVASSGLSQFIFERCRPMLGEGVLVQSGLFGLFTVAVSQLVSNVPFVLLAANWMPAFDDPTFMWLSTALFATLAGNLTILGSVANVIVLEGAGEVGRIGFVRFLRYGALVTVATLVAGFAILSMERALGLV